MSETFFPNIEKINLFFFIFLKLEFELSLIPNKKIFLVLLEALLISNFEYGESFGIKANDFSLRES